MQRQLEDTSISLVLDAMWAANALDIQVGESLILGGKKGRWWRPLWGKWGCPFAAPMSGLLPGSPPPCSAEKACSPHPPGTHATHRGH